MDWIKQLTWYRIPALVGGVVLCAWGGALLLPHVFEPPRTIFPGDSLLYVLDRVFGSVQGLILLITGIAILGMLRLARLQAGCLSRIGVIGLFALGVVLLGLIIELVLDSDQPLSAVLVPLYLFVSVCLAGAEHIGEPDQPSRS